jgi:hypothetical protein
LTTLPDTTSCGSPLSLVIRVPAPKASADASEKRWRIGFRTGAPNVIVYVEAGLVPKNSGASLVARGGEKFGPENSVKVPSSGTAGWNVPPDIVIGAPSSVPVRTVAMC